MARRRSSGHTCAVQSWWAGVDGGQAPAPDVVAAWLVLDELPSDRVPWWAAEWLANGLGGPATAELAGLGRDDPRTVRDLLPAALRELQVPMPRSVTAAVTIAFTRVATLWRDGMAGEQWVVQKVEEIVHHARYTPEINHLPLARLYGLGDEWGVGGGRSEEQLGRIVREACAEQLYWRDPAG